MRRKIANHIFSIFFIGSPQKRAVGGTLGVLLGILPIGHTAWIIGLILCLIFRFNLLAVYLGCVTSLLFPLVGFTVQKLSIPLPDNEFLSDIILGLFFLAFCYIAFYFAYRERNVKKLSKEDKVFVFQDAGRRWTFLKRIFLIVSVLSLVALSVFVVSLYQRPVVPTVIPASNDSIRPIAAPLQTETTNISFSSFVKKSTEKLPVYALYVPWDSKGWFDLNTLGHIKDIDVLTPEWYSLNTDFSFDSHQEEDVDKLAKKHQVKIIPRLNNVVEGEWNATVVHQLLRSPKKRSSLIAKLHQDVKKHQYAGINIFFDKVQPEDKQALTTFIKELTEVFHRDKLTVTQSVPVDDSAYDYEALASIVDYVVVMLYEEHDQEGKPGPLASFSWTQEALQQLPIPESKRIISLGSYGYDWTIGSNKPAEGLTFSQVMALVNRHNLSIQWDASSNSPYIRYKKGKEEHVIWFLDAATFYNQLQMIQRDGAAGVEFWRLGSEDESIWDILKNTANTTKKIEKFSNPIPEFTGDGEILRVTASAKEGRRVLKFEHGWVKDVQYRTASAPLQVRKLGKTNKKKIALTFDDGPDPTYTPQILDVLKENRVKASFYLTGQVAVLSPGLVERLVEEGHEVGNHTYTHPHLGQVSPLQVELELNSMQRLFQAFTGRTMTTFRPPYQVESEPQKLDELLAMERGSKYNYTMISKNIETNDWATNSTEKIVQAALKQLKNGHIVLLHDAGGDRSATVKALPILISELKARGYELVTVSELLEGISTEQSMPPIQPQEEIFMPFVKAVYTVVSVAEHSFTFLIYAGIGVGFIRVFFLVFFSFRQQRKIKQRTRWLDRGATINDFRPLVSVVIAAYNEETVINKTIHSVLQSKYEQLEVIIVNDGSTDQTEAVITNEFHGNPKIHVITQENSGKTVAINKGFRFAKGEIIVSIDADTLIAADTISLLVRHFQDEKVAAVSGNVKVGNVRNLLTLWQHVEYITGFNLERRAFDSLNCIPVVPGAIGAWRKKAIEEVGYFKHDTLAEDTDVTITLLRRGYKIHYEDKAHAYTEAPEDLKSLIKQRIRWIYGTLQCLWKHRGALFSKEQKTLGYISLPNMWIFQYGVQTFAVFVDFLWVLSLFTEHAATTFVFYVGFLLFDTLSALFAFRLEKESSKPLVWLFIQRFVYRQMMSYVVIRSFLSAFIGAPMGWNKLKRNGNVKLVKETEDQIDVPLMRRGRSS